MYPQPFHPKHFLFDFLLSSVTLLFGAIVATPILFVLQNETGWSCCITVTFIIGVTLFYFLRSRFSLRTTAVQIIITLVCLFVTAFGYMQEGEVLQQFTLGKAGMMMLVVLCFTVIKHLSDAIIMNTVATEA